MNILLEQPGTLILIGVLATAIAIGGLMKTGRKEVLFAVIAIPLVAVALLGFERYVVTDREQVRDTIFSLATAVEENDLPGVLEHLSDRNPEARQRAEAEFPRYRFDEVKVKSNLDIEIQPQNLPPKAKATFNVTVLVSEASGLIQNQRVARFVELTLYKEDGQWRVSDYEHSDPMRGMGTAP